MKAPQILDLIGNENAHSILHAEGGVEAVKTCLAESPLGPRLGVVKFAPREGMDAAVDDWISRNPGGARGLIVFSGDGTLLRALERIRKSGPTAAPIAVLPGGGQNRVADEIGLNPDWREAVKQHADIEVVPGNALDINGRLCLVGTLLGEGAVDVFKGVESARENITPEAIIAVGEAFRKVALWGKRMKLTVSADGGPAETHKGTVAIITNNPLDPRTPDDEVLNNPLGNFRKFFSALTRKEGFNTGEAGLYIFKGSILDILSLRSAFKKGEWITHPKIFKARAKTMVITSANKADEGKPFKTIVDGEEVEMTLPLTVTQAKPINFIRPR